MKITIVLGPFQPLPPTGMGAVEKVWHEMSAEFARLGHDVTLVAKSDVGSRAPEDVVLVQVPGFEATGRLSRDLFVDWRYAWRVAGAIPGGDVVITNSFWTPVVLGMRARHAGAQVVHVARFPKRQMGLYRAARFLQAISSAVGDEIAAQSPAMAPKVRVLPYPVDLSIYRPPSPPRNYDAGLVVLYVGRVHPEKGIELLVRSFTSIAARFPRARLRIVGPTATGQGGGGDAWLDGLRHLAREAPVEFVGPIADREALARELQTAYCFCYPSLADHGEAFGLAVLEAMASGLPSVVSNLACFRDFFVDGRHGLVFDHRAADAQARLATALASILERSADAARMGESAAQTASGYALGAVARSYLELFQEAAR